MYIAKSIITDKIREIKKDDYSSQSLSTWAIQYGIEPEAENKWKSIVNSTSEEEFKTKVDDLINTMEKNSDNNGFICANDQIYVNYMFDAKFCLDDRDIYYEFFRNLQIFSKESSLQPEGKQYTDGKIIFNSICSTVTNYFGGIDPRKANIRQEILMGEDIDDVSSIKEQKHQSTAECTEYAAVTHNLWLLAGKESYFITTKSNQFPNIDSMFSHDAHCFNISHYNNKYRLLDFALNKAGIIEEDPIENIKNGNGFNMKFNDGVYYYIKSDKQVEEENAKKTEDDSKKR